MKRLRVFNVVILFLALFLLAVNAETNAPSIYVLEVEGVIDPIVSSYIKKGIDTAELNDAEAVIIQLDTPGGLDSSMREVIKDILESEIPVIVYVHPSGARAASAGSFIAVAAHLTAMTPGTNIGAAHPVAIGIGGSGNVSEKVVNDAAAYMRSLAELKGRNVEVAEGFVRNSTSLTARSAVQAGVVDLVAENYDDLLNKLDGFSVETTTGKKTLSTREGTLRRIPMSTTEGFLHTISNPTVAYLLFLAGIYGIFLELQNPGATLPGVIGGISILLALWAFQAISLSFTGIALILFAVILFVAELYTPTMGILTLGGLIAFIMGSILLINAEKEPFVRISLGIIITTAVVTALFFIFAMGLAIRTHRKKPSTGVEGMIGLVGSAKTDLAPEGTAFVHGELWKAKTIEGKISAGTKVKVVNVDGLTLIVEEV